MPRVLAILRRDLLRFGRNPVRTALLFAIPLVLAGVFVLVFGGGGGGDGGITVRVLLWDEDGGLLARALRGAGSRPAGGARLELVEVGPEGLARMERGEASALLHLPPGFTEAFLVGRPATVELVKNPAERFLPQVVEEGVVLGAGLLSLSSLVLRDELAAVHGFMAADGAPGDAAVAALSTGVNQKVRRLQTWVLPPVLGLETAVTGEAAAAGEVDDVAPTAAILTLVLPGLSMLGVLFIAQAATRDLQRDRAAGLVRQLLTSPVGAGEYVAGTCLSVLVVTVVAFSILIGLGAAAGVAWGDPLAIAALMLASSLLASGLLLLLMSVARSERQGDAVSTIVIIVAAMLGGAFLPLSAMPPFLLPLIRLSPVYWSVDGFTTVAVHGGGLADIAPNLAVLVLAGAACLALGAVALRRRVAAGGC